MKRIINVAVNFMTFTCTGTTTCCNLNTYNTVNDTFWIINIANWITGVDFILTTVRLYMTIKLTTSCSSFGLWLLKSFTVRNTSIVPSHLICSVKLAMARKSPVLLFPSLQIISISITNMIIFLKKGTYCTLISANHNLR